MFTEFVALIWFIFPESGAKESGMCSSLSLTSKDASPQPWFLCDYHTNLDAHLPTTIASTDSQRLVHLTSILLQLSLDYINLSGQ